jgi:spore maturation protein CgeB
LNIVIFCQSLFSDWNHGNAHFLRGISSELISRGHAVRVYEPENSWSYQNLVADCGTAFLDEFKSVYPTLKSHRYRKLHLDRMLRKADLVIVHEWNAPEVIREIGSFRKRRSSFQLLFHDTHHRTITSPDFVSRLDLSGYDGVLAYGSSLCEVYRKSGWTGRAWSWHEAADIRVFRPLASSKIYDVVWIGNWGDDERTKELEEFLIQPVRKLGLSAAVYGVRYPPTARRALADARIKYGGWLPNFRVPEIFALSSVTVHIPRRPYVNALPGIPTIRPFEALACGIPLISAPWRDVEGLFREGEDLLFAKDGAHMMEGLVELLDNSRFATGVARNGRQRIEQFHTCAHRIDALFDVLVDLPHAASGRRVRSRKFDPADSICTEPAYRQAAAVTQPKPPRPAKHKYASQIEKTADGRRRRIGCETRNTFEVQP